MIGYNFIFQIAKVASFGSLRLAEFGKLFKLFINFSAEAGKRTFFEEKLHA